MFFKNKVLLLLPLLMLSACKDDNSQEQAVKQAPIVDALKVETKDVPLDFEYSARAQGSKETEVRARVGGILMKRNYVEGSTVSEGDILFQLDPQPFKVALEQANAKYAQNVANLKAAETQWERISKLFVERIVSEKSRDEARANLDALKAATQLAQAEVDSAHLNLDYTTVKAPIAGVTSLETQSEGSLITVNDSLTNITQLDPVYVIFSAAENEMFRLGSMVERGLIVNPNNGTKELKAKIKYSNDIVYPHEGTINFINPTIDEKTGTLKLRAVFPNPDKKIMPGQFMRLVIEGIIRKNAIIVPQEAVMQSAKGSFVYRINSQGLVESVPVETGFVIPSGEWIIDEGLKTGDVVIVNGLMKVRPGSPAKANFKSEPTEDTEVK